MPESGSERTRAIDDRAATPIRTTLNELFKIGPGPSSSHTMGPMLAGRDVLHELEYYSVGGGFIE